MLLFVTGSSGAGKTTCLPLLQTYCSDMMWYDFERDGIPMGAGTAWRQQKTEYWLQQRCTIRCRGVTSGFAADALWVRSWLVLPLPPSKALP